MEAFDIRRLDRGDSLMDLTSLLHRAFSPMGRAGIACTGFNQSADVTAQRVQRGECFVATRQGRVVGTMTLQVPQRNSPSDCYRRADVASLHQFAVDPVCQGTGCGTRLLEFALDWAAERGFHALALDTPEPATDLIGFYTEQGFRPVERVRFAGRAYTSCVLSKPTALASQSHRSFAGQSAHRRPLFGAMV